MKGPALTLNNGVEMPAFGLGVYQSGKDETFGAVKAAIEDGYRLIDTAAAYGNEAEVGRAIRESGVERSEIFVTTKLKPGDFGKDSARRAFDESMDNLGFDVVDLYLLHWPVPSRFGETIESWRIAEEMSKSGRARAIGVSNFTPAHLDRLMSETDVTPTVNQIELHPYFVQSDHDEAHERLGVVTQAWSPIGGVQRYGRGSDGKDPLSDPTITAIAAKYGKTAAQVVLRWQIELGHSVVPKSTKPERIRENAAIFDFSLTPDEVREISSLDTGRRGGGDPDDQ